MPLDSTPKFGPKNAPSIGDMPPGLVHGTMIRGLAAGANPGQPYGRFGPMFELPMGPVVSDDILRELAEVIVKKDSGAPIMEGEPVDENDIIPAGYTYFGQFVDHDITFDPTPMSVKEQDMGALVDFRTPALDLDNVYGRGPADQPYMYEKDGLRLRVGRAMEPAARIGAAVATVADLHRLAEDGTAVLGDKRNDENKIVSQLHGAMIRFHNKVVMSDAIIDQFGGDRSTHAARFLSATTIVRWHYQYIVLNDFLPRILEPGIVDEVLNKGGTPRLQNYLKLDATYAYIPLEFAGAAYRFGHSMVRPSYSLNSVVIAMAEEPGLVPSLPPGDKRTQRIPLFSRERRTETQNLNGFPGTLPPCWNIDWSFFLDDVPRGPGDGLVNVAGAGEPDDFKQAIIPQPSYRMDAQIVEPLDDLPEFFDKDVPRASRLSIFGNLAFRNLRRGQMLRLPSGQAIATALGLTPLPDSILWGTGSRVGMPANAPKTFTDAFEATDTKRRNFKAKYVTPDGAPFKNNAPLWYYILREAEYHGVSKPTQEGAVFGGQHLGPVGSRIVAETFVALLWLDKSSILHAGGRGFQPILLITGGKPLTLGRLISWVMTP